MPGSGRVGAAVLAATSSLALGVLLGRQQGSWSRHTRQARRLVRSNARWMSSGDMAVASALVSAGKGYLLASWPPAGVKDDKKKQLLQRAARCVASAASLPEMETDRLDLLQPPEAAKQAKEMKLHGDTRIDNFYWMRDDKRADPAVLSYLAQENAYTKSVLADTEALQAELFQEMKARIQEDDQDVPTREHGYYYYTRTREGQQYKIHCRRRVPDGAAPPSETDVMDATQPEEVVLDENIRKAEGKHEFYMVGTAEPSPDHKLLAFSEDTEGGERYTIRVKDIATGKEVMDGIPRTNGDVTWAADGKTLFYMILDKLNRPYKVMRHVIGQPVTDDVCVYEEKDESFNVSMGKTRSEEIILISSGSMVTSEVRFIKANQPMDDFKVIFPRVQDVEYRVTHRGSHFYITIRDKDRPNSELLVAPVDNPSQTSVLLPHSRDVKIEYTSMAKDFMVVFRREDALERAKVYPLPADGSAPVGPLTSTTGKEVAFDEAAYSLGGGCTGDFDSPVLRLVYSSLTTPKSVIDYNMATGNRVTKKVEPVLGGFDSSNYVTERLWATAKDGTRIPISMVYRKDAVKSDGNDPFLLYGYGSYEISIDPWFQSKRLSLLDRGFIFAIAHIRGGGEMGRYWYEDGKYLKKKNTFDDFIACAEYVIDQGLTRKEKLCIEGRSAGGLLMGATVNARPDLFSACIMGVPFLDVVTTMLDETIPLTIGEWEEWGNPKEPEYYSYMKSYSPMDNIQEGVEYPHILVTAGLHDPRVAYWEPAKFVAKMRSSRPVDSKRMLLLKCDMGAGHFSVTGRFDVLKETALELAFLLKVQGLAHKKLETNSATSSSSA